ncbi:MAG: ComF family protein [Patescibacteria group bacterium]
MFSKIFKALLDILFPKSDAGQIQTFNTLFCPVCRARQARGVKICHKDIPYKLAAAARYDGQVKEWIHTLKYRKRRGAIQPIADLLANYLSQLDFNFKNYSVVPIPMFPRKERERGFNQARLIAEKAARLLNLPVLDNALIKVRDTKAQAELENYKHRSENVAGCFAVSNTEMVKNKNIILVDDVYTSGATMNEAVKTLRAAGIKRTIVLVVAKAG